MAFEAVTAFELLGPHRVAEEPLQRLVVKASANFAVQLTTKGHMDLVSECCYGSLDVYDSLPLCSCCRKIAPVALELWQELEALAFCQADVEALFQLASDPLVTAVQAQYFYEECSALLDAMRYFNQCYASGKRRKRVNAWKYRQYTHSLLQLAGKPEVTGLTLLEVMKRA